MRGIDDLAPGATKGISRVKDTPKPSIRRHSRSQAKCRCPHCGHLSYRDKEFTRRLHDLGDLEANRPIDLEITYSQHHCSRCGKYFRSELNDLADTYSHYTRRVIHLAVRVVVEDGLPYRSASWHLWRDHRVFVPWATIQNWVEASGKNRRDACRSDRAGRSIG